MNPAHPPHDPSRRRVLGGLGAAGLVGMLPAARAKDRRSLGVALVGLGYYSRARNIMEASKTLVRDHHGIVPDDYEALRSLPGIGQYTAGAILSIAFNKAYPVVDGNVRRVLSRIHGWEDDHPKRLWDAAGALVRQAEPRIINQAIMELGATVCSFRSPRASISARRWSRVWQLAHACEFQIASP